MKPSLFDLVGSLWSVLVEPVQLVLGNNPKYLTDHQQQDYKHELGLPKPQEESNYDD